MTDSTDVTRRLALPPHIRDRLLDCPRDTWRHHPGFGGKADFFLRYHESLRRQAAHLKAALQDQLNEPGFRIAGPEVASIAAIGKRLVQDAEHHHRMEEAYYFPVFAQTHPSLRAGIELLDGDHKVLSARLDELDRAVSIENKSRVEYGQLALAYERADGVAQVLGRHLHDEEEVIIPIFLGET